MTPPNHYFLSEEGAIVPTRAPRARASRDRTMEEFGSIYGLSCRCHSEEGVRYVGMTKRRDPLVRFDEHLKSARSGKRTWQSVYEWIAEHGSKNFSFEVIESGIPGDQLRYRELSHIRGLRGAGNKLMNQDDFWWVDASGKWQHTWPDWHPFIFTGCVSAEFVSQEFDRGIYPLTFNEYRALFRGVERQTVGGLASFLTPEGVVLASQWRHGLPDLEIARQAPEMSDSAEREEFYKLLVWATSVREKFDFPRI
jgi:hypothetical protein